MYVKLDPKQQLVMEVSQVLRNAFARLSRQEVPQVMEAPELLWRNANRERDERLN